LRYFERVTTPLDRPLAPQCAYDHAAADLAASGYPASLVLDAHGLSIARSLHPYGSGGAGRSGRRRGPLRARDPAATRDDVVTHDRLPGDAIVTAPSSTATRGGFDRERDVWR
jgi:hypothetical protein